ncbi:MAG: hypothetical protein GF317_10465 [Candidatus Lokiarchaeota archaeon]|nr:hypothetical protein [Candidatus Lokiarchaeota archaeon]MBD3200083.1 hypothetical protein [Candidatus Lokiarchaeota archaeon]
MFQIEDSPTGTTKCAWCEGLIEKDSLRLRFAPSKGYNYYWHQDCGIKYLEGLKILLQNGEKGLIGREKAEKARSDIKL